MSTPPDDSPEMRHGPAPESEPESAPESPTPDAADRDGTERSQSVAGHDGAPQPPGLEVEVLTLFPGLFPGPLGESITGRALAAGVLRLHATDVRQFATDRHHTVDDYPYGGGPGMVMRPGPLLDALAAVRRPESRVLLLSPAGRLFRQELAVELARERHLVLICGRYEGIDARVPALSGAEEVSIGDFVLTGGELAAMVVLDAVMRLLPGVLASSEAWRDESHANGLLEYPQYTRPVEYGGLRVPEVLLSGHHAQVAAWRRRQALERTHARRPELLGPAEAAELERLRHQSAGEA